MIKQDEKTQIYNKGFLDGIKSVSEHLIFNIKFYEDLWKDSRKNKAKK